MPIAPLSIAVDDPAVVEGLALIRQQHKVPGPHPPEVVEEASAAAARVLGSLDDGRRRDARDIAFVTIDPPGSRDLDQAVHIEARTGGRGWRVRYAIADVGAFVTAGGALDAAVGDRGFTYYLPDGRAPLHPPVMGEDAASLLPDRDRAAVLWTVDLDTDGAVEDSTVERAVVRSRAQLTYEDVQRAVDGGTADDDTLVLLREVGQARYRQEIARGGVSLDLPAQEVEADDGGYRITFGTTLPSMSWNAQVSLLTGMVAARRMDAAGTGLLRTMPPAGDEVLAEVRRVARALHVGWPEGATYAEVIRTLHSDIPDEAALLALAARGLRGAGYLALPSESTGRRREHGAVAALYAHVTAPLRRLGDRYAIEACLAVEANDTPPAWVTERLPDLPTALQRAAGREAGAARAAVDLVEALVLRPLVGRTIRVSVVSADDEGSTVVCRRPAIQVRIQGHTLPLGEELPVRIAAADPIARRITLSP